MREPAFRDRRLTVDEYLRREERSPVRHEYVDGVVYAMTGTTIRHGQIVANLLTRLRAAAAGPCRVFANDIKVRVGDRFYYPDVVVSCVPLGDDDLVITEPSLIVEVTSPSTKATDRREKVAAYRQLPSLRAYLVVDHRRRRVEMHVPNAAGVWEYAQVTGDEVVPVPCPATTLTLDAIYEGVTIPNVRERAPVGYGRR